MIEWIDSHCHLDKFFKKGNLDYILDRAKKSNVFQMISIGTSPKDWLINSSLSKKYLNQIYYTIGLHPCYVDCNWVNTIQDIRKYFESDFKPVALGEIGLDFFHLPEDKNKARQVKEFQNEAFLKQLAIAKDYEAPVVIHSRCAFEETISLIDQSNFNWNKVVMHCYSYSAEQIKILRKRGGRASFTGIVTYKNAPKVKRALVEQGIETLMIETDCPYLAPEPYRGKINEPGFVSNIGVSCADIIGVEIEKFSQKVCSNTRKFFGLKKVN